MDEPLSVQFLPTLDIFVLRHVGGGMCRKLVVDVLMDGENLYRPPLLIAGDTALTFFLPPIDPAIGSAIR